jgi:hypothetical protein
MITLTAQQSAEITFGASTHHVGLTTLKSIIMESGLVAFSFAGQLPNDWTRDTLSFPVGQPCAESQFISGIVSASPASFQTAFSNQQSPALQNTFFEYDGSASIDLKNAQLYINGTAMLEFPASGGGPSGCAVESASVAYSAALGRPLATLALAVFGSLTTFLGVSYAANIAMGENLAVGTIGGGTIGNRP